MAASGGRAFVAERRHRLVDPGHRSANNELRTTVIRLRREIKNKQGHVGRLTILVQQRSNTIDDLRGKLEQSRQQIQQLNEEADHLAALVRMS